LILFFACVISIPLEKRCERMVAGIQCLEFLLQLNFSMACAILHSSEKFRFRFSSTSPYKKIYMPRRAVYELMPASRVVLRI